MDVQPEMITLLKRGAQRLGVDNVEPVQGAIDDPRLPEASVDAVLMVDAYHEFSHPFEMMQKIFNALRPGGRVSLVEYRGEGAALPIKPSNKMAEAQARAKMANVVGLIWEKTRQVLPTRHLMVRRKSEKEP